MALDVAATPSPVRSQVWRTVLALAWPVLAQQFLILTVGLSDRFLAGHIDPLSPRQQAEAVGQRLATWGLLGGPAAGTGVSTALAAETSWAVERHLRSGQSAFQAAQTSAHYLAWFISSYTVLVSAGGTALVARFVGAGDRDGAVRATNQSILLACMFGVAGTAIGLLGVPSLLRLLQLGDEATSLAAGYLRPMFVLLTLQVIQSAGLACLIGAGDTRPALWVTAGVALINLPLAWGFYLIGGADPRLRFVGIAVGTALSQAIGGLVVLAALARGRAGLWLRPRLLRPDFPLLHRLLRVSIPAGVDSLSIVVGQFWFLSIVNRLGDTAAGAHGIAIGWEALGYLSGTAFGTAAMALVGQNLGAGRPAEAARCGWVAFGLGCGLMSAMGVLFFVLAPAMFALFCPSPHQRPIIEAGVPVLRLVAFAMPALASCIVFTFALRGAGDTRVPVLFTWIGFLLVRIPLAYFLTLREVDLGPLGRWPGADLGLFGAWMAMFVDLVVRGGFFLVRYAGGRWQRVRV